MMTHKKALRNTTDRRHVQRPRMAAQAPKRNKLDVAHAYMHEWIYKYPGRRYMHRSIVNQSKEGLSLTKIALIPRGQGPTTSR